MKTKRVSRVQLSPGNPSDKDDIPTITFDRVDRDWWHGPRHYTLTRSRKSRLLSLMNKMGWRREFYGTVSNKLMLIDPKTSTCVDLELCEVAFFPAR